MSGFKTLDGQSARNAGTYQIVSDAYSDQQGYDITAVPGTLTVTPAPLTITAVSDSKIYDGTTISLAVPQVSGLLDGDTISNLSQSFTTKYAGAQGLNVDSGYVINDGNNGQNYIVTTNSTIGFIQRRRLTVTGLHALDKVYEGTNYTEIQGGVLQGVVPGDDVSLVNGVGTFNDKNVGASKPVIVTGMSLAGRDAFNYILENPPGLFASITPKPLSVTGLVVQDKTYDGTSTATLLGGMLQGVVSGDDVSLVNGIATFSDRNAGSNKPVTVTGMVLTGADAGNYTLIQPTGLTGTILPAHLVISSPIFDTKVYDGTTTSATIPEIFGLVSGDTVSNLSLSFDGKNAGRHHMVFSSNFVINDGNGGNNYTVEFLDALGYIEQATLTIAAAPDSKVYDGNVASSGIPQVYGLVNGDTVTNLSQTFDSRNAGSRILTVNGGYLVNDDNAGNNYNVSLVTANGTISQASLVLSAVPDTRVYDGTTVSNGMPQASGLVNGDTASGLSQAFDSRNAGSRTLVVNGSYVINDGNGGNNYAVTLNAVNGMIEQAPLAISAVPDTKAYDGTITSRGVPQVSGMINGDTVSNLSQSFDNKNAGNRALVVNGNYSINDGNGGNNYAVIVNTAMGSIDPATLTLAAAPDSKVYDGTTTSAGVPQAAGLVAGDTITDLSQAFDNKNAGPRILVVTGYALNDGNLGNNYRVLTSPATGEISPAQLVLSAVPDTKIYDATTSSKGVPQVTGLVNGDTVSSLVQSFDNKNAGSRTLAVNGGYVINDGNGGNNYTVTLNTANGSIDQAPLTIAAVSDTKGYDGTNVSSQRPVATGLVNGDTVGQLSQVFDSRNAGSRTLIVNGDYVISDGNGGNNYRVTTNTANGTITQATLTITAMPDTKIYDGTAASSVLPSYSGLVNGDTVSNLSQVFDSRNAGTRTLVVNGHYVVNDGNGGNNYLVKLLPAQGSINQAPLTVAAVSDTKVYDGTTISTRQPTASGLVNGDTVTNLSQSFDSRDAGSRLLRVSGYVFNDGNNGNNYAVTTQMAPGSITPKALTVSGQVALNKTYDGTNQATLQGGTLVGVVGGDNVSLVNGTATFNDKNVGTNKPVTVTGTTLGGTNAGNYTVSNPTGLTASITPASLTLSAVSDSKVYDGTTTSTKTPVASGLVSGDTISNLSQSFDSKNAGSRTLRVNSGYTLNDGNSGKNYTVTTKTATGSISKAALKLQAVPDTKKFDNTTISKKIPQALGLVAGDTVSKLSQSFDKKTPGIRTLLVNSGYVINDSNNGNNYTVTTATAPGLITP